MTQWSEAWLREHQTKMAHDKAPQPPKVELKLGSMAAYAVRGGRAHYVTERPEQVKHIEFTLRRPTPLLNTLIRMHWRARGKYQQSISGEIAAKISHLIIRQPFTRALVSVDRYSIKEPDHDGLVGGLKLLIDCLLICSKRHPDGLSLIVDDSPDHLELRPRSIVCHKLDEQRTVVHIQDIS